MMLIKRVHDENIVNKSNSFGDFKQKSSFIIKKRNSKNNTLKCHFVKRSLGTFILFYIGSVQIKYSYSCV